MPFLHFSPILPLVSYAKGFEGLNLPILDLKIKISRSIFEEDLNLTSCQLQTIYLRILMMHWKFYALEVFNN